MALRARGQAIAIANDLTVISLPFLVLWTLALAILCLCRPRPWWGHLVWQPGLWACGAAFITLVVLLWTDQYLGSDVPPAIVLVLGGHRVDCPRSEWPLVSRLTSLIDRAGWCLGFAWAGNLLLLLYLVLTFWGF